MVVYLHPFLETPLRFEKIEGRTPKQLSPVHYAISYTSLARLKESDDKHDLFGKATVSVSILALKTM
jgi:hypothetical protein